MSITPSLVLSSSSGFAPFGVVFDATGTTCTETQNPFHELLYIWDFGDPNSGVFSTTGLSRNSSTGPIAAHVYENGGTYNPILTIIAPSGDTIVVHPTSISVTATDDQFPGTATVCISQTGNFAGKPAGAQEVITSNWQEAMSWLATNRRVLLRKGETWDAGTYIKIINMDGPAYLGSFGTGDNPKIYYYGLGDGTAIFRISWISNWKICDLSGYGLFPTTGSNPWLIDYENNTFNYDIVQSRLYATGFAGMIGAMATPYGYPIRKFVYECTAYDNYAVQIFTAGYMSALLGCNLTYSRRSHNSRVQWFSRYVVSNCRFVKPAYEVPINDLGNQRHNIKAHKSGENPDGIYLVMSDNICEDTALNIDVAPQDALHDERMSHIILERNRIKTRMMGIQFCCRNATARNNVITETGEQILVGKYCIHVTQKGIEPAPDYIWVYGNSGHSWQAGSTFHGVSVESGTNIVVRNNLFSSPNYPTKYAVYATVPITQDHNLITDNPGWVNPGPSGNDYNLQESSLAIDAGIAQPGLYEDFDREDRDALPDLGAYEMITGEPEPPEEPVTPPRIGKPLTGVRKTTNFF